ncbi:hypothetical protein [Actinomadura sp. HBU206391]|uniref:hypothetical protein n=1 Tax=Actinomadura sp. HBU206391 TaxID=2731692 RepID=UPI00164FA828|nr:hypothetical protein [Actinomadura sp. HBU206391]MBC6457048.1 hypothetical protein [Actinomadura sp. HBU206391]
MNRRKRMTGSLITSALAAAGLVTAAATPAFAASHLTIGVNGSTGAYLGYGNWNSAGGAFGNGTIAVCDHFEDGDNGIIAGLYRNNGATLVNLVSVRGENRCNTNSVKADGGPRHGELITFKVCSITPDGVWKNCRSENGYNT